VSSVSAGLDAGGLRRLHDRLAASTESGQVPAMAALLARGGDVHTEILGRPALHDPAPLRRDAIFRIASLSKPIAAAGTMLLVDDGMLSLSDPVEAWLPELAGRRVLRSLGSPLDDTRPSRTGDHGRGPVDLSVGVRRHHGPARHLSDSEC
jgi:CubicO group peptidase (beta-lactamase class C family)